MCVSCVCRAKQVLIVAVKPTGAKHAAATTPTEPAAKRPKAPDEHPEEPGGKQGGEQEQQEGDSSPAHPLQQGGSSSSKGQAGGLGAMLGGYVSSDDDDADSSRKTTKPSTQEGAGPSGSQPQAGSRLQQKAGHTLPDASELVAGLFGAGRDAGQDAAEESGGSIST